MQSELTSAHVPYVLHTVAADARLEPAPQDQIRFGRRRSVDWGRVLVIDADNIRSAQIAAQIRAVGAFETRTAGAAASALDVAEGFTPDIVLLNMDVTELAPYRLAASLRYRPALRQLRMIALTSDLASVDRQRALAAGFERYLTIPVRSSMLRQVLGLWSRADRHSTTWSELRFLN
jgi:CheY-like chemotaxis protein